MGRRKVVPKVVSALSFAFLLSSSLQVGSSLPAFSAGKKPKAESGSSAAAAPKEDNAPDSAPQAIGTLEQRLFFKKFRQDALDKRVARIETRVYGEAINGPLDDRISKLTDMLQSQLAEEAKKKEAEAERQAQAAEREKQAAAAAAASKKPQPGSQDSGFDRAKLDIQAAKEEEVEKLIAAGTELYRAKRGQEAISKFEEALRLDPTNPNAHFSLGIIYEAMGNYAEALSSYQQASKEEPGNPEYKEAVASMETKANSKQNMMGLSADLKKLVETANANWKAGDYIGALNMYMEVDQKAPDKGLIKYNIGSIYLMMKDQMNALEYYKQAAKIEPSNPRFVKAYNELNAEYKKSVKAQDAQEQQQLKDYKEANAPPRSKNSNKNQKVQKLPGQTQKLSPQMQQIANQMAAQMKQVPRSMPGQQPMQQQSQWQQPQQMMQQPQQMPQQQMQMPQQQMQMPQQQMQMPQQQQQWPQQQMQMPQQQQQWPQQQMQMPQQQQQWPQQQMQMPQQQQQWPQQQMQMPQQQQQWPQQQMQMPQQQQQWPQQQTQQPPMQQPQMQQPRSQMPMPKMPTGNPSGIQPAGRSPYGLASNTVNQMTQQTPGGMMNPSQAPAQQDTMSSFGLIGRGNGQGVTVTNVGIASRAASAGIIPGDDIRAVDGIQVTQPNEINNILQQKLNSPQRVPVMIMRGGNLAVVNL